MKHIDILYDDLNRRIKQASREGRKRDEASGKTYAFASCTLQEAKDSNTKSLKVMFIVDVRKPGEGAGNGTGLPCFFDPQSENWLTFNGELATS